MPLQSKDLERSCGNGSSRRRPFEAMLSREPLEKEDTPNICTFLGNCYERYKITLFPNLTEIIRSKFLELPNQANKCCTQSSPSLLQISCPLWYRRLVEIHQPITTCKCKVRRDEQRKTKWRLAGGEAGRASRVLLSVFKLESSSSAWEDPKLPIVSNPSRFCPSVLQHGYQLMAQVGCWAKEPSVWHEAIGLMFRSWDIPWDLCAAQTHLGNPIQQWLGWQKGTLDALHHTVWMRWTHIHADR